MTSLTNKLSGLSLNRLLRTTSALNFLPLKGLHTVAGTNTNKVCCQFQTDSRLFQHEALFDSKLKLFNLNTSPHEDGFRRDFHSKSLLLQNEATHEDYHKENGSYSSTFIYLCSAMITMFGAAYAAVPLYKIFCQKVGLGGDPKIGHKIDNLQTMKPIRARKIRVIFNANANASMLWNFKPSQSEISVVPGETALAFYTARNPTDEPIVGVATYNVVPYKAGLYFNKIQCFCFEEQWLNPDEEVDMPVFFYIDPDFDDDPDLAGVTDVTLSYTFFRAKEGMKLPLPGFMTEDFSKEKQSAS